ETQLVTSVALLVDPDGVFKTARGRIDLVFKLRLALAVLLAILLTAGLAVLLVGAVRGTPNLAAAGGGTSVLDLMAVAIFKPLDRIRETIVDTQQLDLVHLIELLSVDDGLADAVERPSSTLNSSIWFT